MTPDHRALKDQIETAFERRSELSAKSVDKAILEAVQTIIKLLDQGQLRVAEKIDEHWQVNQWVKKAILLYFRIHDNALFDAGYTHFYDKVPLKFAEMSESDIAASGVRLVPPAIVRKGAYVAPNCVLMPSYVNMGAYIDSGSLIDTWATVGSCAQVGKNVHLSGGAGIGGVLEPLQANPTIIEDNCFIGARSEIVEGVIVETGAVIGMGVFIGASTRIYNR
ncbi:MAG: 2,3,4,5-tetrahydropyridine-2,6-dicarboxylate N-succinyltransferase, partial [Gammaproteobacteria bacterium]